MQNLSKIKNQLIYASLPANVAVDYPVKLDSGVSKAEVRR